MNDSFRQGTFLMIRLLGVIGFGLLGRYQTAISMGIGRILIAPRLSQRKIWFDADILTRKEEGLALMSVSGLTVLSGIVWITIGGWTISFYTLLVWTIVVVGVGYAIQVLSIATHLTNQ